jgi:hypothetical protein
MIDDFRPSQPVKPAPKLKPTQLTNTNTEPQTPFKTPEEVSLREATAPLASAEMAAQHQPVTKPRGSGHHWFNLPWPPSKQEIILISLVVAMAAFGVIGFLKLRGGPETPVVAAKTEKVQSVAAKPTTVPSTLSGLPVADEINQRPVVGVMIENSAAARPQSGLSEAGVVFEAIAEGGITRFLALFQDQQPTNIGPVRSARPYYVQWNQGFQAAYAHVGGSADALQNIKDWGVQDINQFSTPGPFRRESSRAAPHNMYSNVAELANVATQKGFKSDFKGFERKTAEPSKQPTARNISVGISSAIYNSNYVYDQASNTYLRSEGGAPQTDANTGKQLAPNVVVTMVVPMTPGGKTSQGGSYSNYNVIGTGPVQIFQDGVVIAGNWNKADTNAPLSFTDSSGKALKLNPGQTWITAVSSAAKVTYN